MHSGHCGVPLLETLQSMWARIKSFLGVATYAKSRTSGLVGRVCSLWLGEMMDFFAVTNVPRQSRQAISLTSRTFATHVSLELPEQTHWSVEYGLT